MTGIKLARIRECSKCEFSRNCGAWSWPRCCHLDRTGEKDAPERNDAFMEGPPWNCSAGKWAALKPVEMKPTGEIKVRSRCSYAQQRGCCHVYCALKNDVRALRDCTPEQCKDFKVEA